MSIAIPIAVKIFLSPLMSRLLSLMTDKAETIMRLCAKGPEAAVRCLPRRPMTNGLVIGRSPAISLRINELRDPSNRFLTTCRCVMFSIPVGGCRRLYQQVFAPRVPPFFGKLGPIPRGLDRVVVYGRCRRQSTGCATHMSGFDPELPDAAVRFGAAKNPMLGVSDGASFEFIQSSFLRLGYCQVSIVGRHC
jgi:hypothetical protein